MPRDEARLHIIQHTQVAEFFHKCDGGQYDESVFNTHSLLTARKTTIVIAVAVFLVDSAAFAILREARQAKRP